MFAAGFGHTVLLRSDGSAVACGQKADGRCDLPALVADPGYTQVAAGARLAVLLRVMTAPWAAAIFSSVGATRLPGGGRVARSAAQYKHGEVEQLEGEGLFTASGCEEALFTAARRAPPGPDLVHGGGPRERVRDAVERLQREQGPDCVRLEAGIAEDTQRVGEE